MVPITQTVVSGDSSDAVDRTVRTEAAVREPQQACEKGSDRAGGWLGYSTCPLVDDRGIGPSSP